MMRFHSKLFLIMLVLLAAAVMVFGSRAPLFVQASDPARAVSSSPAQSQTTLNALPSSTRDFSVTEVSGPLAEEILGMPTSDHGSNGGSLDTPCWVNNTDSTNGYINTSLLDVGDNVWVWFNPNRCNASPYPFRVDTLRWAIYWPGAGTFTWRMHISCPTVPGDSCSTPGGTSIWTSGDLAVTYSAAGGHYFSITGVNACVSGPFFLGMEYVSWTGSATLHPSVIWKQAAEPTCIQYLCDATGCTDWTTVFPSSLGRILARVHGNTNDACTPVACQVAQPCVIPSQPGDVSEVAEPWPVPGTYSMNDPDGGCNNSAPYTPQFQDITCGTTIFGKTFMYTDSISGGLYRDTDWYRLVLNTPQQVTWSARGEIPVIALIVQAVIPPCSTNVLEAATAAAACSAATVTRCLAAGTYYLWVGGGAAVPSTAPLNYRASLTCATCPDGRCCYGPDPAAPLCANGNFLACEALSGTFTVGETCANPCPVHLSCGTGTSIVTQPPMNPDEVWTAVTSDNARGYAAYDDFHGLTQPLGGIRFWGLDLYYNGGWAACTEDPMPFQITVYNDSSGYPALATPTHSYTASLSHTAAQLYGTYQVWQYDYVFSPPIVQSDGWISCVGVGDTTCWYLWANSPYGNGRSLQWTGAAYTVNAYDLGYCVSSGACLAADSVTAYLNSGLANIVVRFYAPAAGNYEVWSTTDKNAIYPATFTLDATVAATAGDNAWTDPTAPLIYKRYTVVHNCNAR
jgi:hypothetical protein